MKKKSILLTLTAVVLAMAIGVMPSESATTVTQGIVSL